MTWKPKNLLEALIPGNILFALLGHAPFQYPIGRPRIFVSIIYTIITGCLFYVTLGYFLHYVWLRNEDKVYFFVTQFNILIAGLSQFLSWYHGGTLLRQVTRMMKVDETLQKLGATINYASTLRLTIIMIIYWLTTVIGLNLMDVWWLHDKDNSVLSTYTIIATLHHPAYVNFIVALNFCLGARIAEMRFYKLNELIVGISESYFQHSSNYRCWSLSRTNNDKINQNFGLSTRRFLQFDENRRSLVQTIKHVHLEIMGISRCVDKIYGVQMALQMATYFISFTGLLYELFRLGIDPYNDKRKLRIFTTIVWAIVTIFNLTMINQRCESVIAEARRTGDVINCIYNPSVDEELSDEIKQFSLHVMNNPLHFSPGGFFPLGDKFMLRFLSTVMTYLIILIQSHPDIDEL